MRVRQRFGTIECIFVCFFAACGLNAEQKEVAVSLFAVTPFGETVANCKVTEFRGGDASSSTSQDHHGSFAGLEAKAIPLGEYDVSIECGRLSGYRRLVVHRPEQFELITTQSRKIFSDVKPMLRISLKGHLRPHDEVWWVRLVGLFANVQQIDRFTGSPPVAQVINPKPGHYIVIVQSSGGYHCSRRIEVTDQSSNWAFESRTCAFDLDEHSRLLKDISGVDMLLYKSNAPDSWLSSSP